ncbi:hypothetical protein Glove_350g12 [Diversispora epigaea]|uniref:Uncharacterized protein n=1 Tax=Diversispora epigaea TaxID=1348612 RepID=A0A397HCX3_9GLOM|nr:hypothetical protein Glove_350g12 [Diversispora epigaea]
MIFRKGRGEFILRILIFLILTGALLYASIHEIFIIFKVQRGETLISMSINDLTSTGIPIWNSFICSQNLTRVTIETIKRGINSGNNTRAIDTTTSLPDSYISKTNTNALTTGDWTSSTGIWPCYIFNNSNKDYKFMPGTIDQFIITAYVNGNQSQQADFGLIFGVFDDIRPLNMVEPFTAGIPSINTFTFTLTEKVDINNKEEWFSTVNKQNTYIPSSIGSNSIVGKFLYSPETYSVYYQLSVLFVLYCWSKS